MRIDYSKIRQCFIALSLLLSACAACAACAAPPSGDLSSSVILASPSPSPTAVGVLEQRVSSVPIWNLATATPQAEGGAGTVAVTPTPTLEEEPADEVSAAAITQHTVQSGETLLGLALAYDVPMAAIQLRNDLGEAVMVHAGQVLEIPPAARWADALPFWVVRVVQPGETLSGIAALYDLSIAKLRTVNDLSDADMLAVGQPLIMPLEAPVAVAQVPPPTATLLPPTPVLSPTPCPVSGDAEVVTMAQPTAEVAPSPTPIPPTPVPVSGDIAAWPMEVFNLINAQRAAHGLPPYTYNETLAQAARLHGQDCLQRGWCGHTGSDGSSVRVRVSRAGYDMLGAAECIVYSPDPQTAVAWWMDEVPPNDAHRRTLLSTWLTEIGISVTPIGNDTYYFIADFGRPN